MKKVLVSFAFTLFFLSACAFSEAPEPMCPLVVLEKSTADAVYFKDGGGKGVIDRVMEVRLMGYKGSCEYNKDHTELTFTLNAEFEAELGAAAKSRKQKFSYFVAVPQFYPEDKAKQVFTVEVDFPQGVDMLKYRDEPLEINIPVKASENGKDFQVYIGMQLDKNMLEYNRTLNRYQY
ncbi:MAG: hypothetical protein IKD08_06615 [Alphaproteobacteria bacterium]|nr:hypothetical protein [Alphaproteobacteria bacterium]